MALGARQPPTCAFVGIICAVFITLFTRGSKEEKISVNAVELSRV